MKERREVLNKSGNFSTLNDNLMIATQDIFLSRTFEQDFLSEMASNLEVLTTTTKKTLKIKEQERGKEKCCVEFIDRIG